MINLWLARIPLLFERRKKYGLSVGILIRTLERTVLSTRYGREQSNFITIFKDDIFFDVPLVHRHTDLIFLEIEVRIGCRQLCN